jgi:sec-independent protein translocase protein TatA
VKVLLQVLRLSALVPQYNSTAPWHVRFDLKENIMGSLSIWHWAIVLVIVFLVFGGKGKISDLMGDAGKGIKSFKKGLADDVEDAKTLDANATDAVKQAAEKIKS